LAIIGEHPHPAALFIGFDEDDASSKAMAGLVAHSRFITQGDLHDFRLVEWDILVTTESIRVPGFIHVLAFGVYNLGNASSGSEIAELESCGEQPSKILHVADDLSDPLRRLVAADLVPYLASLEKIPYVIGQSLTSRYGDVVEMRGDTTSAFVRDADGHFVAGSFARHQEGSAGGFCWSLPFLPPHPEQWLALALRDWHEKTPHRVPLPPGWRTRSRWQTAPKRNHAIALAQMEERRRQAEEAFRQEETELTAGLDRATASADLGIRRLLTHQGGELVDAVRDALTAIGFVVTDVDEVREGVKGQPKLEDLAVSDPHYPDWTNVTEVRGYTGGAKVSDLQRIGALRCHLRHKERRTTGIALVHRQPVPGSGP
jgi:hypothetical protein